MCSPTDSTMADLHDANKNSFNANDLQSLGNLEEHMGCFSPLCHAFKTDHEGIILANEQGYFKTDYSAHKVWQSLTKQPTQACAYCSVAHGTFFCHKERFMVTLLAIGNGVPLSLLMRHLEQLQRLRDVQAVKDVIKIYQHALTIGPAQPPSDKWRYWDLTMRSWCIWDSRIMHDENVVQIRNEIESEERRLRFKAF